MPAESYNGRLDRVRAGMNCLPRGTRVLASNELGVSKSMVSNLLNRVIYNPELLVKLELWVKKKVSESDGRS